MSILQVHDVSVDLPTEDGVVHAVQHVSFDVDKGEVFGIVGESGSGKSVLTQAITGLMPGAEVHGSAVFDGVDLLKAAPRQLRSMRGNKIGMIFQDPLSSLHPYFTIGSQIVEVIKTHEPQASREDAKARAVEMLEMVGIKNADKRFNDYPHQFSGGMRQRVMIAMALVLRPEIIIADEPTTALDVTIQKQVLDVLRDMSDKLGTTVVMISHDLTLLGSFADRAMVMYAGHQLETGPVSALFSRPAHPYTLGLLHSSPDAEGDRKRLTPIEGRMPSLLDIPVGCVFAPRCPNATDRCGLTAPPRRTLSDGVTVSCWRRADPIPAEAKPEIDEFVLQRARDRAEEQADGTTENKEWPIDRNAPIALVEDLHLTYNAGTRKAVEVLKGIDLTVNRGDSIGLVGESGCGKTTLARVIAGLLPATSGTVTLLGQDNSTVSRTEWREQRRHVQLVFQDPYGSLNPRRRIGSIIGEPIRIQHHWSGDRLKKRVQELMELVGLNPEHYNRYPGEFSGGQRQRIGIARALALDPELIIFDEPVSALDVSIQAQILNLIQDLQDAFGYTYLFISHDLAVVRHVCSRVVVIENGRIVERGDTERIYDNPQAPFTKRLLAASIRAVPPQSEATAHRTLVKEVAA
ncbi:dipeptide ABC transporter ATP-binding protein [Bifidobacterium sp. SMB2]|uniref:Dipeptide ABC transporter ATP-binding protein n=1 Tax=Bifidobacterium saimiriisciurei TaxID=2661627 RepID=A0ABX0CGN2_9BIFI|nr:MULTISPECIES: ABC transporter ATP-binding protein [Bifidobacterium]NEG96682.1 dipeptide ABC transporter ATP-binding protein [Bifidobacterium sp. SMB2]NEH11838.1 dipeptide ABC transporter ATP-binding protein [Bifidobacterium saimiriisciurei]